MIPRPPTIPPPSPPSLPSSTGPDQVRESGAWATVLRRVKYPLDVILLDWETFFSKTYRMGKKKGAVSTIQYIESPHFEELGVACLHLGGKAPFHPRHTMFWPNVPEQIAYLQAEYGQNLERCTVVGWNLRFDGTILARKYGVVPPYAIDAMSLSRHLDARNRHNLREVAERYNLTPKGDTEQFSGLHWRDMTPEQQLALSQYACNDVEIEADLFQLLLPRLTRPEVELPLIRHTLRLFWEPELAFDFEKAEGLIAKMDTQVVADTEAVGATPKQISGTRSFVALLTEALGQTGEQVPMKQGKRGMIAALAKDDESLKNLQRHHNLRVRQLIKARQAVKSWPLHQKRLRAMIAQATAAGGRLPNPLNYYGAHTGRWSGGEGVNTCNLPTRGSGLQVEMKKCLLAPPGHTLILADAAQIEARGTAWIAGQTDLIAAFAQDQDVYSDFAAEVLAAPVRKPRKTDPPPVAKLYAARRAIGKVGILGMGYGMGAARALEYMLTYPELAPKVESGEIDLMFCKRFVDAYRNKYQMVPKFWRDLEQAFKYVTKYGKSLTLRGLTLSREGTTIVLTLPSGRSLFYPHARVTSDGRYERIVYHWGDLWGGTLTENVIQAASRDILAGVILYIEDKGFHVVHHCYDSVVVSIPETKQDVAYNCVCEAFTRVPIWAEGWPLGVEALISKRYD